MITSQQRADALRVLSMDMVQKAQSGHPGAPMGMADMAEALWHDFLRFNPTNPKWINRDRFILSNGHASALLYSLLHLTGYNVSLADLKQFRQLDSITPGHPEMNDTPGVETTTGPLGQGLANAIGMALAEKQLAQQFNRDHFKILDHYTYVFLGDGCLMEGISHEVCSLAGTWKLGKLICLYDANDISIDGKASLWFTDDTKIRFQSYGWQVIEIDGHDNKAIKNAVLKSQQETIKPSLIICRTIIGKGAITKEGNASVHGAPLGKDEIEKIKSRLKCNSEDFHIADDIRESWNLIDKGKQLQQEWDNLFASYTASYPDLSKELQRRLSGTLPDNFSQHIQDYINNLQDSAVATRKISHGIINHMVQALPEFIGGSADLSCSNLTNWSDSKPIDANNEYGNYIYYGVREFGMTAINNGIAAYGGFIPFAATFLVFMEYARNAVRMAAIMKLRSIFIYTHDSIGVGEDGPTHQPLEQLANLRNTPHLNTWRPANSMETVVAWMNAVSKKIGPSALVLSRQTVTNNYKDIEVQDIHKGAYIIHKCQQPEVIILATGSEVDIAIAAASAYSNVQVVSMPCVEVFMMQDLDYREKILPKGINKRIAVEASHSDYWFKFVGLQGIVIGMQDFGKSAPASKLYNHFNITQNKIKIAIGELLQS